MRILLTGATGFIGSRLADAIEQAGHRLRCTTRYPERARRLHPGREWVAVDASRALVPADWQRAVERVDVVVNAVGIFQEDGGQTFEAVHARAPQALFEACVLAGVGRVLQVSALGADGDAPTRFLASKHAADEALRRLPVRSAIVQPSLVFGAEGPSARRFLQWAVLPVVPVPGGSGAVQPLHVEDLVALLMRLLQPADAPSLTLRAVGPRPLTLAGYLGALRAALGLAPPRFVTVPAFAMDAAARLGSLRRDAWLTADSWRMLQRGNTADPAPAEALLGRPLRPAEHFVAPAERPGLLERARFDGLLPWLRLSLAFVWIATGLVSLGLYPVAGSLALLARVGATGTPAWLLLYGAAAADLLLGIATLWRPGRALWWAQAALILFYTAVITWRLPEFWLHPYGPLTKNLPMLALLAVLLAAEEHRR